MHLTQPVLLLGGSSVLHVWILAKIKIGMSFGIILIVLFTLETVFTLTQGLTWITIDIYRKATCCGSWLWLSTEALWHRKVPLLAYFWLIIWQDWSNKKHATINQTLFFPSSASVMWRFKYLSWLAVQPFTAAKGSHPWFMIYIL